MPELEFVTRGHREVGVRSSVRHHRVQLQDDGIDHVVPGERGALAGVVVGNALQVLGGALLATRGLLLVARLAGGILLATRPAKGLLRGDRPLELDRGDLAAVVARGAPGLAGLGTAADHQEVGEQGEIW